MNQKRDIWDEIELATAPESLSEEMFYLISAYADGECSLKERRLVEAYLAENSGAREMLADIRAQAAVLMAESAEPPAWLRDAILNSTSRRPALLGRFGVPRVAALAGCAAAAALAVVYWPLAQVDGVPVVDVVAVGEHPSIPLPVSATTTGPAVDSSLAEGTVVADVTAPPQPRGVEMGLRTVSGPKTAAATPAASPSPSLGTPNGNNSVRSSTSNPAGSTPPIRMGPESGPVGRAIPEQPDVVAMAGMSQEGEESFAEGRPVEPKSAGSVGVARDPRLELRKRLEAVNQNTDVQDAFKGSR